jgi:cytochrome c oxidase subunit 2
VRRRLFFALLAGVLLALTVVAVAGAANGGFTPVTPHSPNAHRINTSYYFILGFTGFVFVLVEALLIVFIVRFRSRGRARDVDGPQIHGNTNIELAWTVAPVVILALIAGFVLYEIPGIKNVPSASAGESLRVKVEAHQFYWQFDYPEGEVSINKLVVPANAVVRLDVVSPDVAHSWWVPALGGKIDTIPGRTNHAWFKTGRLGTYRGQCTEFCGLQHAMMRASVQVVDADAFTSFRMAHRPGSRNVGDEVIDGACATCHGDKGQGLVGPKIAGNPLMNDRRGLTTLLREGREPTRTIDGMPAVGKTWSNAELNAVIVALKQRYGAGS